MKLEWRDVDEGWFASHPIGNGRCVEITVCDDILMMRDGGLQSDYVVEDCDDARKFAARMLPHFIAFADSVSRLQWAASNLEVVS